jgi:hypothetical protein
VDWIILAWNRDKYQAVVNAAADLQAKYAETAENFVIFSAIYGFASLNFFLENFSLAFR